MFLRQSLRDQLFLTVLVGGSIAFFAAPIFAADLGTLDQHLRNGDLSAAADEAIALDQNADPTIDLTLAMARLGRAFQKAGDDQSAVEFYSRAVLASQQPAAGALDVGKVVYVRLAAASAMTGAGKYSSANDVLRGLVGPPAIGDASQVSTAVDIAMRIGRAGLSGGDGDVAADAFAIALSGANDQQRPVAMLGAAWTAAISQTDPLDAAKKLAMFVDSFPDHPDAPRASRACAECLRAADRHEDADTMLADLLRRWPQSESAVDVVRGHLSMPAESMPPEVADWMIDCAVAGDMHLMDAQTTSVAMTMATRSGNTAARSNLARHLANIDQTGQSVSDLLSMLTQQNQDDEAERLASMWISPADGERVAPAVCEAACRWAGRTQRWSMLSLASENELDRIDDPPSNRTVTVDRLFAESLMQVGRVDDAAVWWNHLVDVRNVDDFATLLRCAEAETSVGTETTVAASRIELARAAVVTPFDRTLVDMLAAELDIRRTRFADARARLESVVRGADVGAAIRGRAQWLIGETHFLQAQFPEAIDAYRSVEAIDPGGDWVAASLVQAGKSFEQLGRTREAAVCYGSLLARFADSPHAGQARKRLATIDPNQSQSNPSIRR